MPKKSSVTFKFPNGETIELFYIGTLAYNLGRAVDTVRKWEIAGVIPETCFKDKLGCRLYSQEQIDAIVESATNAKLSQGRAVSQTNFTEECTNKMQALKEKYAEKSKKVVENEEDTEKVNS